MASVATNEPGRADGPSPRTTFWRIGVVCLIVVVVALLFWVGAPERLTLPALRSERVGLLAFVHAHPWQSLLAYVALYTVIVGLSLPGALVMTLMGGFLFGPWEGGAAAVVAVSLGSIFMFLIARTAVGEGLRAWLAKHSNLVRKLEAEVRAHPFTTILTLRLIPAAPICLVNLAAGFVRIPIAPYALATVIGVIPSTFLYASVGDGLDRLFDTVKPEDLMNVIRSRVALPALGLFLLAAVPIGVRWWTGRREAAKAAA